MTRHYGHDIQVRREGETITRLVWRETSYRVLAVLGRWRLRNRWWAQGPSARVADPTNAANGAARGEGQASDRTYYRLECAPDLQCDVYYDAVRDAWVLDRVHD